MITPVIIKTPTIIANVSSIKIGALSFPEKRENSIEIKSANGEIKNKNIFFIFS